VTRTLVIESAPRTKKNSLQRVKRGKRIFTVGSDAHRIWEQKATWQLRTQWHESPWQCPVEVTALVYREKAIGDLVGFLQAIGDVLEKGGVIENDRQIASWDGSRLLKDTDRPRVEVEIRALRDRRDRAC